MRDTESRVPRRQRLTPAVMTVERDPRATTAQQCSKGLILLKKQTTYLSKALILHAHEIGTFCIDCTGTPCPMKTLNVRLISNDGDELETFPLEKITVAEEWDEAPSGNTQVTEYMADLLAELVSLLRERQAAPWRGLSWLKLALGEAVLTAHEHDGDVVLQIIVRPLTEGEEDEFDSTDN
jgi:hypothetical protein